MIPLKDETPRRSTPVITLFLIAVNVAVFFYSHLSLSPRAEDVLIRTYGLVPVRIEYALAGGHAVTYAHAFAPFFTCMFLHAGWLHIIGNMWFLWIFGANVEDRFGPLTYLMVYLVCGIGSGISQVMFSWGSPIPSIGASGAISGILGAYLLFFPSSRILTLIPLFIIWFTARIPAFVFILLWFAIQFLSGLGSLGAAGNEGGVAWWAHVGGFTLGFLIAWEAKATTRAARYG
ncbi:MAG TPA: rhomboid family intramembrane serine protease [Candidatus Acidoferrum sp.]|nr:rhomboid family intramembrane serine protease [Candidatus Acidoferrum sp.]